MTCVCIYSHLRISFRDTPAGRLHVPSLHAPVKPVAANRHRPGAAYSPPPTVTGSMEDDAQDLPYTYVYLYICICNKMDIYI